MTRRLRYAAAALAVIAAASALTVGLTTPAAGASARSAATSGTGLRSAGAMMQMPMSGMPMSAGSAASAARAPATRELHRAVVHVTISNFKFEPQHIVVSRGTRIVWTNKDSEPHTVTSDRRGFASQALNTGGHYTLVAGKQGTFAYHCQIHPFMHGLLVVQG
ncbi:MAG: cupredoxin domain-containing protein [Conexibacteraceae bacterium]|nr:cupredoxin domain-containing protein [Conexibacteraceae bacterium]